MFKKLTQNNCGYFYVSLYNPETKIGERHLIHRLVATHFIRKPEAWEEIDHIDRDKSNNYVANLHWVSRQENISKRVTIITDERREQMSEHFKRINKGSNNPSAKLNEDNVRDIKRFLNNGIAAKVVAGYYNVGLSTIYNIKKGVTWNNI